MRAISYINNMINELLNELDENIKEENYEKVIEIIDSIISLNPDLTSPLLLKKSEALIELDEYEKAIFLLKRYLNECEDCKEYDAYTDLAECYSKLNDIENEEKYLLKAYDVESENFYIIKKLVYHYFLCEKHQECIDFIEKLIEKGQADLEDYSTLVYSQLSLGNVDDAIEHANEVIKIDPTYVDMYVTLTIAYEELEDEEKLNETYRRIIELEDDGTEQLTLLKAQSYLGLGLENEAFKTVDKAIKAMPYNPFGYIMKGMLYQDIGKMKEAWECFEEAYKLEPKIIEMMAQKGNDLNNI